MIIGVNLKMLVKMSKTILVITVVILLSGCGKEVEEAKSMEQIRNEEGVPVRIEEVKQQPFQKTLSFFTQLEGIKEATKGSMVGGRIERIRAKVGDNVVKDQVVIEFAEDNPGLQYEQAKTALDNAEKTYNRMKALLEAGETSQASFDGTETNYLVSKRNFESLQQMLHVQAPFSGTILELKVNEGDNVKNEIPLFKIAQVNRMRTKIWANEDEIVILKRGMKTYTEMGGKRFNGVISDIAMAIDPFKRAFYAEVEFDNPGLILKSGMTADVKVLVYDNPKAVVIPRNLVMNDINGMYIFVAKGDKAEKRYISNGRDNGIYYEVSKGLMPGEMLVTQGGAQLSNGTKVKVIQ
jgi:membrane fusion protein, multidrug efflux system